jgi:hypothetical protein
VTIDTLTDNLNGAGDVTLDGTGTCSLPLVMRPSETYACEFTSTYTAAGTYANVATASGADDEGEAVSAQDGASVEVSAGAPPSTPAIEVVKTGTPLDLDAPGGRVTYSVEITNTGNVDGVAITALADNLYGDITATGHDGITATTCAVPRSLRAGATYRCSFTVDVVAQPGTVSDVVTVTWNPPGGGASQTEDSNRVTVTIAGAVVPPAPVAPIPTLAQWALLLLAGLLALVAIRGIGRQA